MHVQIVTVHAIIHQIWVAHLATHIEAEAPREGNRPRRGQPQQGDRLAIVGKGEGAQSEGAAIEDSANAGPNA